MMCYYLKVHFQGQRVKFHSRQDNFILVITSYIQMTDTETLTFILHQYTLNFNIII